MCFHLPGLKNGMSVEMNARVDVSALACEA